MGSQRVRPNWATELNWTEKIIKGSHLKGNQELFSKIIEQFIEGDSEISKGFPCGSAGKESTCSEGDLGSIPGLGRSPGEGKGYLLQYSGLENSTDTIYSPWGHRESDTTERLSLSLSRPITGPECSAQGTEPFQRRGSWQGWISTHDAQCCLPSWAILYSLPCRLLWRGNVLPLWAWKAEHWAKLGKSWPSRVKVSFALLVRYLTWDLPSLSSFLFFSLEMQMFFLCLSHHCV